MRTTKFFRIGIASLACVLALLLAIEAGFIPVALAGKPEKPPGQEKKPPHKREYRTEYGYAILQDGDGDVIKSDGKGQYVDCTLGGEDLVQLDIYNDDNSLRFIEVYAGKMTYHHPTFSPSTRRVNFLFNIDGGIKTPEYMNNKAVYDILLQYKDVSGAYIDRSPDNFLDDGTLHAPIVVYTNPDTKDRVQFVVDLGYDGKEPKAITQAAVDSFYDNDENADYWDTGESRYGEAGQVIYTLYYDSKFIVASGYPTWTVTASGSAKLGVGRYSGKGGRGAHKVVYLSEYSALPFQLIVSVNSLEPSFAPRKNNTLSSSWGELKAR